MEMAAAAADLGVELFVLDDGWFGRRDDDTSSLGDWTVDARKLPSGLPALVARINDLGLAFGLWIEPEMVNPDSRLFEAHPEWAVGIPGRSRSELRNQLVLDLSNPQVVEHLDRGHRRGPRQRPDRLREVGHEPHHHRALRRQPAARAAGRVLPPLRAGPL